MAALEILRKMLIGNFYSRFSVGDTFDFYFDDYWLIAQDVTSSDERALNNFLLNEYKPAKEAVDKEDVSKTIIICSTLRKCVTDVCLESDSTLKLVFDNCVSLNFPTNTEIVDWHWAINEKANDPYESCIIGCFSPGEVVIGSC